MHAKRLSRPMPRRAGCPTQRSSLHCRRARRPRCLTSPPMTWALRRTPSGRPVHPSQPTTLRKLGPRNASGSGDTSLPLSANSFLTINNAGAPSAGTRSTTDERSGSAGGAAYSPSRGRVFKICCRCMTCRGTNSATVSPNISMDRLLRFRRAPPSPLSTSTPVSIHGQGQRSARSELNDHSLTRPVGRSLRLEAVAHSGLGDEVARPSRIVFKLLSECLDVLT